MLVSTYCTDIPVYTYVYTIFRHATMSCRQLAYYNTSKLHCVQLQGCLLRVPHSWHPYRSLSSEAEWLCHSYLWGTCLCYSFPCHSLCPFFSVTQSLCHSLLCHPLPCHVFLCHSSLCHSSLCYCLLCHVYPCHSIPWMAPPCIVFF